MGGDGDDGDLTKSKVLLNIYLFNSGAIIISYFCLRLISQNIKVTINGSTNMTRFDFLSFRKQLIEVLGII